MLHVNRIPGSYFKNVNLDARFDFNEVAFVLIVNECGSVIGKRKRFKSFVPNCDGSFANWGDYFAIPRNCELDNKS